MTRTRDLPRRIYGKVAGKPMNFSLIDELVGGSACPMSKLEVEWLRKKGGASAILSLTERPLKSDWVDGLRYKNVPMKDHAIPELSKLIDAVDFINAETKLSHVVVVHCMAGKGRTGVVLASYMCEKYGLSPAEAISKLRLKRPGSVERAQVPIVEEFFKYLGQGKEASN